MNTSHPVQVRRLRKQTPSFEKLDSRIVPAAMHAGAAAVAELAAGASVQAGEAGSDAARGLLRREIRLERRILRREIRLERLEARSARLEARYLARHHRSQAAAANSGLAAVNQNQPISASPGAAAAASPVAGSPASSTFPTAKTTGPSTATTPVGTTGPLPANVDQALDAIYEEYENGTLPTTPSGPGQVEIQGNDVGVMIHVLNPGDFATVVADAQALGLQVTVSSPSTDNVAGLLPIAELPSVAELPESPIIVPIYTPVLM